jgi:dTDP-4-dehydrorhamnose reductase
VRALITGGGGQLASDLAALLGDDARSYTRPQLDITDPAAVDRVFDAVSPDVVFNCAAFHNVEVCEAEPDRAWEVNVRAVRDLARRGAKLVHVSTNYVFDGRRAEPYREDDLPAPRSVYALTKLAGEHAALAYGDRALVVRAAGLYGLHGSASKGGNFVQRMTKRAKEQGALKMVADQRLQPTFTGDLAAARSAEPAGSCTSRPRAPARGLTSRWRSWRSPGSKSPSNPFRRRSHRGESTGRSTAYSHAPGPTPSDCPGCGPGEKPSWTT